MLTSKYRLFCKVDSNRFLLASESSPKTSRVEIWAGFRFASVVVSGDSGRSNGVGAAKGVGFEGGAEKGEGAGAKAEEVEGAKDEGVEFDAGNALEVDPNAPFDPNALVVDPPEPKALVEVEGVGLNPPNDEVEPNALVPPPPPNAEKALLFGSAVSSACCVSSASSRVASSVGLFQLKLLPPLLLGKPLTAPLPLPLPLPVIVFRAAFVGLIGNGLVGRVEPVEEESFEV